VEWSATGTGLEIDRGWTPGPASPDASGDDSKQPEIYRVLPRVETVDNVGASLCLVAGPLTVDRGILWLVANIPVDIRNAPLGDALAAIYEAVLATNTRIERLEIIMADLGPVLARLEASSAELIALVGNGGELQRLLDEERAASAALAQAALETAASEDAEDVNQNAALSDAVAARDAAVAATDEAAGRIGTVADNLSAAAGGGAPVEPVDPNA
jgi:hypothetical protein